MAKHSDDPAAAAGAGGVAAGSAGSGGVAAGGVGAGGVGAGREILAAGAVLWRPAGGGGQLLLIHRPKYDDWTFAKGKLEPGEHVLLGAVREVAEETGMTVTLGRRLLPVFYAVRGEPKRVDWWAATVAADPGAFEPNHEVDQITWLATGSVRSRLSYAHDADTLAAFQAGPPQTSPLIFLRHASAGEKSGRPGDDDGLRPLDADGLGEASLLASLLRCFGPRRIVSAPAERCLASVRPYAAMIGGQVEIEPAFDVSGPDRSAREEAARPLAAEKTVRSLAAMEQSALICGHRENLPDLIRVACDELGVQRPPDRPLRKGEFLVLHRAAGQVVAADRYHPDGTAEPASL